MHFTVNYSLQFPYRYSSRNKSVFPAPFTQECNAERTEGKVSPGVSISLPATRSTSGSTFQAAVIQERSRAMASEIKGAINPLWLVLPRSRGSEALWRKLPVTKQRLINNFFAFQRRTSRRGEKFTVSRKPHPRCRSSFFTASPHLCLWGTTVLRGTCRPGVHPLHSFLRRSSAWSLWLPSQLPQNLAEKLTNFFVTVLNYSNKWGCSCWA